MPTVFAVMAISNDTQAPEFVMAKANLVQEAVDIVHQEYQRQGRTKMKLVAVFTRKDLAGLDAQMAGIELQHGIRPQV